MDTTERTGRSYAARSRQAALLTLVLAVVGGACFAIGLGAAFGRSGPDVLAPVGLFLLAAAAYQNLVAFGAGVLAWRRDRAACRWIYLNGLLILVTIGVGIFLLRL